MKTKEGIVKLTETQQKVLAKLSEGEKDYDELWHVGANGKCLAALVRSGHIEMCGEKRAKRWCITSSGRAAMPVAA